MPISSWKVNNSGYLELAPADANFGPMIRVAFTRLRALILLAVFAAGVTGHAMAATTIGGNPMPHSVTIVAAMAPMAGCSNCPASSHATMPSCSIAFCWSLLAVPAHTICIEPVGPMTFVVEPVTDRLGMSRRPEPHPPRPSFQI